MSLGSITGGNVGGYVDVDPGYISDVAMEQLCIAILTENLTPDELSQAVQESTTLDVVTEKNIVKLDKKAQLQKAYKMAILQCAAEDGRKEYKKLRTLWKMEAFLTNKLEKIYKNKAAARAKESMKKMKRSKPQSMVAKAVNRVNSNFLGKNSNKFNQSKAMKGIPSSIKLN